MAIDWSAVAGCAGGVIGVAGALVSARQKFRVDELKAAQDVISLKQQHIDELTHKLVNETTLRKELEAKVAGFIEVFSWQHIPPSLQAVLDRLEEAMKTMVVILKTLDDWLLKDEKRHDT